MARSESAVVAAECTSVHSNPSPKSLVGGASHPTPHGAGSDASTRYALVRSALTPSVPRLAEAWAVAYANWLPLNCWYGPERRDDGWGFLLHASWPGTLP